MRVSRIAAFRCISVCAVSLLAAAPALAQTPARPAITGISHISVYATDMKAADHYYADEIGAVRTTDPENPAGKRYMLNATQFVEVLPLPANAGINRLDHTAYNTADADALRKYLLTKGWRAPAKVTKLSDGSKTFRVSDPEGNVVEFVQPSAKPVAVSAPLAPGHHIIHVGFLVHSRETEDTFYRAILGFRPYWFGGMQDDKVDWVSQQTPDGHDWLEYMMTSGPSGSGIPKDMSLRTLGVLDHFSIGVTSVPASFKTLTDAKRLDCRNDGKTQIGRDGKAQFNMYDPDGIRMELMEFHATAKPCCSAFTAEDPAE